MLAIWVYLLYTIKTAPLIYLKQDTVSGFFFRADLIPDNWWIILLLFNHTLNDRDMTRHSNKSTGQN